MSDMIRHMIKLAAVYLVDDSGNQAPGVAQAEAELAALEEDRAMLEWWIDNCEDYTLEHDCVGGIWGYYIWHKHWDHKLRGDTPRAAIRAAMGTVAKNATTEESTT